MSRADISHLFVYGTLMVSAGGIRMGAAERERLHAEATWLGPATLAGTLYDLGAYPALVADKNASSAVHGEILQLTDAEDVFRWLDAYEGIDASRPDDAEYARIVRPARLADGREIEAWVYVYRTVPTRGALIADGRWKPPTSGS